MREPGVQLRGIERTPQSIELMMHVFEKALRLYTIEDIENISANVSERNICARLGCYLQREAENSGLRGYYADAEYNRQQNGQLKTIVNDDYEIIEITCDLILHSRGRFFERDNMIAIEAKKRGNSASGTREKDRTRLRVLTRQTYDNIWSWGSGTLPERVCNYLLGVFIEIDPIRRLADVEYYVDGNLSQKFAVDLDELARSETYVPLHASHSDPLTPPRRTPSRRR